MKRLLLLGMIALATDYTFTAGVGNETTAGQSPYGQAEFMYVAYTGVGAAPEPTR